MNKLSEVAALLREAADKLEPPDQVNPFPFDPSRVVAMSTDDKGPFVDVEQVDGVFERYRPPEQPEPVSKPAPKFQKGDRVRHRNDGRRGTVNAATENPPFECAVDWGSVGGCYVESALELDDTAPAPASPEPKAGQVWVYIDQGRIASGMEYVLSHDRSGHPNPKWRAVSLCGENSSWNDGRNNASEAISGLTFAAPTVADYYQRELLARVAELEKERASLMIDDGPQLAVREGQDQTLNYMKLALGIDARTCLNPRLLAEVQDIIQPALAAAREQGAKQAREERFVALDWVDLGAKRLYGTIYDRTKSRWATGWAGEDTPTVDQARAEAARLNAAEKLPAPPKEGE